MSFQKAIVIATLGKRGPAAIQMADVSDDGFVNDGEVARKRRRLTHLSTDEKILRRKLKNRVAAQTARDRKKALMQELEEKVALLVEENKQLLKENTQLRLNQTAIRKENEYLKKVTKVPAPSPPSASLPSALPPARVPPAPCKVEPPEPEPSCEVTPCKTEPECPGSAEGTDSSSVSCDDALRSLCSDFKSDALLNFLEEFCGEGELLQPEAQAGQAGATALGQFRVVVRETGTVVEAAAPEAGLVGSPSADVDSINELIQSDHQYHKEEPRPVHHPALFSNGHPTTSLLDGRVMATTTLPPSMPQDLSTRPTFLQSGPCVSTTSSAPASASSTKLRSSLLGPFSLGSAGGKLSMATMVDPNMVYSPRPRVPQEPTPVDADVSDTDFLSEDMLESLEGLWNLEDLADFSLLEQKPNPEQSQPITATTVTITSIPPSTKAAGAARKASQRKQKSSATSSRVKAQPPAIVVSSVQGLQSSPSKADCLDGYQSPESGFVSDGSEGSTYLSDSSPSPASLSSTDMEGLSWHEDFVSIGLDLFPDVGLCVS